MTKLSVLQWSLSLYMQFTSTVKLRIEAPGFYQYKWVRPPACMQGPASIRGPACIITCQVWVILFKKIFNFHVYRYQYFVYFHTKTAHIEKVQKRSTKLTISLKKYSYKDRLIQLNLHHTEVQKIAMGHDTSLWDFKQKYDTAIVPEISLYSSSVTRANNNKLLNQIFTTTYRSIHLHRGYPRLVCGTRLVTRARLLPASESDPGLYAGPGVYPGPSF